MQHYLVKPSSQEHTDNVLSEECKLETDINEDAVKNSSQLEQVLEEVCVILNVYSSTTQEADNYM